jgi:hypothetical protein
VKLVHELGVRHQLRHCAEWLAAKIGIRSRNDHTQSATSERSHQWNDARVQELRFVDGDHIGQRIQLLRDLNGRVNGNSLDGTTVMTRDRVQPLIPLIEVRFEHLHLLLGDHRTPDSADELFALTAEHAADDDFDPADRRGPNNIHL